jgi:hypothetical protein
MITAPPPAFLASLALELLAGRVVPAPFDESTVVEGIVFPTIVSSSDVVVRSILAAGLENAKTKSRKANQNLKQCTRL